MSKSFTIDIALPNGMTPARYRNELEAQLSGEATLRIDAARPVLGFDGTSIIIEVVVDLVVAVSERVFRKRIAKAVDFLARRRKPATSRAPTLKLRKRKKNVKVVRKGARSRESVGTE